MLPTFAATGRRLGAAATALVLAAAGPGSSTPAPSVPAGASVGPGDASNAPIPGGAEEATGSGVWLVGLAIVLAGLLVGGGLAIGIRRRSKPPEA